MQGLPLGADVLLVQLVLALEGVGVHPGREGVAAGSEAGVAVGGRAHHNPFGALSTGRGLGTLCSEERRLSQLSASGAVPAGGHRIP